MIEYTEGMTREQFDAAVAEAVLAERMRLREEHDLVLPEDREAHEKRMQDNPEYAACFNRTSFQKGVRYTLVVEGVDALPSDAFFHALYKDNLVRGVKVMSISTFDVTSELRALKDKLRELSA